MAYANIEPFGAPMQDMQNAMVCFLLASGLLNTTRPFKFEDFLMIKDKEKPVKEMNWKILQDVFKRIAGYQKPKKNE
jgi:hypothetical protein